jgi:hypothetical protein
LEELKSTPGQMFLYRGPRRFGLLPTSAPGQVLGFDDRYGVVHACLYWEDDEVDELKPDIAHMPIVRSVFQKSIQALLGERDPPPLAIDTIQAWRNRRAKDGLGAFTLPIWRARRNAWRTALKSEPHLTVREAYLAYAFPRRGPDGAYRIVEVERVLRNG